MKNFISAAEIEELAAQGVRELTVDDDTVLTAVARETAAQRGIKLVAPGAAGKGAGGEPGRESPGRGNPAPTVSGKPKGCQHGPVGAGAAAAGARPAVSSANPVVDDLIGAVKQLARAPHSA